MFARQVSVNCYSTGSANKMLRMDTVGIELFQKRERKKFLYFIQTGKYMKNNFGRKISCLDNSMN